MFKAISNISEFFLASHISIQNKKSSNVLQISSLAFAEDLDIMAQALCQDTLIHMLDETYNWIKNISHVFVIRNTTALAKHCFHDQLYEKSVC